MNVSDYDRRQLELMQSKIDAYSKGNVSLRKLISDIEALLDVFEDVSMSWRNEFKDHWAKLEEVYAWAASYGTPIESEEDFMFINLGIEEMSKMLKEALND